METPEKIIELNFNRRAFEQIYFKDKQDNIFLSRNMRGPLLNLIISIVIFIGCILYSMVTDKSAWLIVVLLIPLIITFLIYFLKASKLLRWRKSVVEFMDKNCKFKSHKLILTNHSLCLIQDNTENINKWSTFTNATIENDYLTLTGNDYYFFPKKSMSPEDYTYLTEVVKSQIKNGHTITETL